ncbi:hypothetical protein ACTWQE_23310 [Streptomyces sp. 8N706]
MRSPVAVLDQNVNSFGLITLPHEKHPSYRVRPSTTASGPMW